MGVSAQREGCLPGGGGVSPGGCLPGGVCVCPGEGGVVLRLVKIGLRIKVDAFVASSCEQQLIQLLQHQVRIKGGPGDPGPPLTLGFEARKIEHFWALFNFSIFFFCLASLGILFL